MNTKTNYYDQYSEQLVIMLDKEMSEYKANLNAELNSYLYSQIQYAESEIEKAKVLYLCKYAHEMEKLKIINGNGTPGFLKEKVIQRREDFTKRLLERGLKSTIDAWKNHIAFCQSQLK